MSYRRVIGTVLVIVLLRALVTAIPGSPRGVPPITASTTTSTSAPSALAALSGNGLTAPKGLVQVGTQVWVANNTTSTLSRFNPDGTSAGNALSGNGLNSPYGITVVGANQVWVVTAGTSTIARWQLSTTSPTTTNTPPAAPTATNAPLPPTPNGGHAIKTVFLIVMENHNWSSIKGNPSAPDLNTTLLPMASHAEQYYNPPGNHPRLTNYLWLEAGTNVGIADDNPPISNTLTTTTHPATLLSAAGISWKAIRLGPTVHLARHSSTALRPISRASDANRTLLTP